MKILEDIRHINRYLLNPKHDVAKIQKKSERWRILFSAFIYDLVFTFCIVVPLAYFVHYHVIRLEQYNNFQQSYLLEAFITAVIFAPFIEEILFRMPLKYENNYLFIFFQGFTEKSVEKFWIKHFKIFFYILCLAFGFMHLSNYKNQETIFYLLSPIIIMAQNFAGFIMGYIRMHLGLLWSILLHGLHNFTVVIVLGLMFDNYESINIKNNDFSLVVNDLSFYKDNKRETVIFNDKYIYKIDWENESFEKLIDTLYQKKYDLYDDQLIKVKLHTTQPLAKEKFLELLKEEYEIELKRGQHNFVERN